jgi:hypothetical protein
LHDLHNVNLEMVKLRDKYLRPETFFKYKNIQQGQLILIMATTKNIVLVWHYTNGERAKQILQFGFIRGATANVPENEFPVVWFSMNQTFEPTAVKAKRVDGVISPMTIPEMIENGQGLARFGVVPRSLLNGDNLRKRSGITSHEWARIQKVGVQRRADPRDWYGSIEPIEVSLCVFEVMNEIGKWERVETSEWLRKSEETSETAE